MPNSEENIKKEESLDAETEQTKPEDTAEDVECEECDKETKGCDAGESESEQETDDIESESDVQQEPSGVDESETDASGGEKASEDSGAKENKKERKLFKKKEKKKDKKDEKIDELSDRLVRQMAEFDNYRKRTEKEKAANYIVGAKDVIEKLLPIVDNFERGLADANLEDPFADGMDKVYKQLTTILEGLGVEPIEAVGKEFDPNLHNAVMHVDDEELGENIVAEEFQKGYMYKGQVVRHSMVRVAN